MAGLTPVVAVIGGLLLLGSLIVWSGLLWTLTRGSGRSSWPKKAPPQPPMISLMLTVFWTATSLLSVLAVALEPRPKVAPAPATEVASEQPGPAPAEAPRNLTVANVQLTCATRALLGAVIGVPLLLGSKSLIVGLGLRRRNVWRQVLAGVWGYLVAIGPVTLVWWLMAPFRNPESQHPLLKLLAREPSSSVLLWIFIAAAVIAPAVEELQYRVVLQSAVRQRLPRGMSILVTAIIFAMLHGWPDAVPLMPLALVLGAVFEKTRSYLSVVVLHVLFNATNIVLLWLSVSPQPAG